LSFWIYARLVVLTAGTLLPFFWVVVILGHRRQRNFERILFFLCLSLIFFFGASLLALNAQLYYATIPAALASFAWTVVCLGLWLLPCLLLHVHAEYEGVKNPLRSRRSKRFWLAAAYLPALALLPHLYAAVRLRSGFDFVSPTNILGVAFQAWLLLALVVSAAWQGRFARMAPDAEQKSFHRKLRLNLFLLAIFIFTFHNFFHAQLASENRVLTSSVILTILAVAPLLLLIHSVEKFNFLQIGRQRNLMLAVFVAFVALLYLSLVRRASSWLDPFLPPEATSAILLFLPVVFFEPLQKLVRQSLRRTAQTEMDHAHRMMGPIRDMARLGDSQKLHAFVEKWIAEQLQLAAVALTLNGKSERARATRSGEELFSIQQSGESAGHLRVTAYGAMLSGETVAAVEYLCEQLPGALDLCRLIEEKLQLERELAERERLAVLGQMAASISHNLKNPLGSIKTILQVQMEGDELPESLRGETKMVLEEIGRLSAKLHQLLQFSRPAVRGGGLPGTSDARAVIEEVAGVMRHEAERKGIALDVEIAADPLRVAAHAEAVHDVISNLVVNGLEATGRGGQVRLAASLVAGICVVSVEDDGPGVPESARQKILQPFFTTKSQGTGLGLAIVTRRVAEFGGKLGWVSPVKDGKGTRFEVEVPAVELKSEAKRQ